jgi:hypothetical protein
LPETLATLTGALIGGFLALLGVWFQHRLRRRGKLYCIISDFRWEGDVEKDEKDDSRGYTFYIKVFNEQEVGTGVRDVDVMFFSGNEKVATDRPRDAVEGYHADYLNFPPREWVVRKLKAGDIRLEPRDDKHNKPREEDIEAWRVRMRRVMKCNRAKVSVRLPDNRPTLIEIKRLPMPADQEEHENITG